MDENKAVEKFAKKPDKQETRELAKERKGIVKAYGDNLSLEFLEERFEKMRDMNKVQEIKEVSDGEFEIKTTAPDLVNLYISSECPYAKTRIIYLE